MVLCDWWGGHSLSETGWDIFTDINEFDTYQESHVRKYVQFMVYRLFTFLLMSLDIRQHLAFQPLTAEPILRPESAGRSL